MLKQAYLLAYNGTLMAGWAVVLARTVAFVLDKQPSATYEGLYPLIEVALRYSQTAALVEILHALVGLVRSPVATTFIQVMSRILVLWGVLEIGARDVHKSWFFPQMIIAWAVTEVIRYFYYALSLVVDKESTPRFLTWLRYSTFLLLYPMGITGEIMCLYNALPFIQKNHVYSVALPNTWNFAFDFYSVIWFILLGLYPGGSYVMYTYMLGQRKKVLRGATDDKKKR